MTRRHVPTAGQFFGFLALLMALSYGLGLLRAHWCAVSAWLASPGPWWAWPAILGVAVALVLALVVVLAVRRPEIDSQRECCAEADVPRDPP
ncbi:MAG TPA: hypothetical protein VK019_07545 [Pseudomonas sp.]|nr:hypothetical protein [Pseudomonas sp.]